MSFLDMVYYHVGQVTTLLILVMVVGFAFRVGTGLRADRHPDQRKDKGVPF